MTGTYLNREGEVWFVHSLCPDPHSYGMWWGVRTDTGRVVHLHHHRLTFHEQVPPPAPPQCAPAAETTNPS